MTIKGIVLAIVLVLAGMFTLQSQNVPMYNYSGWQASVQNPPVGYPGFYYAIFRSEKPLSNGQYKFSVYFSSNAYIYDYNTGSTVLRPVYVFGIYLNYDGRLTNPGSPKDITVDGTPKELSSLTWYTYNAYPQWYISWEGSKLF